MTLQLRAGALTCFIPAIQSFRTPSASARGPFPARVRDGELDMMYMPQPPYNATGGGSGLPSGLSPSHFSQSNQTVDCFNRSQDTYVIAVGAHL